MEEHVLFKKLKECIAHHHGVFSITPRKLLVSHLNKYNIKIEL